MRIGDEVHGAFQILHCCGVNDPGTYAYGNLRPTALFVGVPEPGAWALIIAGFGLVGAAARRRGERHRRIIL